MEYDTERIKDASARLRERKRLRREWSQTLPRENPYTREQVENSFRMPEPIEVGPASSG